MLRTVRLAFGIACGLAVVAAEARAQYYPGYGRYGWGGWGGGSTVQGDIARGLGFYNIGAGVYNRETAIANSINTDTVTRWNQYLWLSQQEANRREYLRMARRQQRDSMTGDLIYQRLRDNPTPADIASGNALNVVLDQVTDPKIQSSALRLANDPISSDVIDDIPFVNAASAVTISLHQLTAKDQWPRALQDDLYAPERQAWTETVAQALKEDESGRISPQTLSTLRAVAARIRAKFEATPPADREELIEGRNYVKTLLGLSRMLADPQVEKVLAELEKSPKTSLGSLLGFMHFYNLRFGKGETPQQRAIYDGLYPKLVVLRDRVLKDAGVEATPAPPRPKDRPIEFFQGMHLDHLEGKPTANGVAK